MALGEPLPDELVLPRFRQPLAIRFLTAEPGPLPAGRVTRIGPLDPVLAQPGVVQAETYLRGRDDPPVRLDGDRRGYVIATRGHVDRGARARRGGARGSTRGRGRDELRVRRSRTTASCSTRPQAGGYRFATSTERRERGDLILRHDVDLSLDAAVRLAELEASTGAARRTS
jgi:hypothetical protein